jgi:hypothetical protein
MYDPNSIGRAHRIPSVSWHKLSDLIQVIRLPGSDSLYLLHDGASFVACYFRAPPDGSYMNI